MSIPYIRRTYGLHIGRGATVRVGRRVGRVTRCTNYVWILFADERKAKPFHPQDERIKWISRHAPHTTPPLFVEIAKRLGEGLSLAELRASRKGRTNERHAQILRICIAIARELHSKHGWRHAQIAAAFGREESAVGFWLRGEIKAEGAK